MNKKETLKQQILQLSREYYDEVHRNLKVFEPGKSFVNYGGRFFDAEELVNLIDSSLDFGLQQDLGLINSRNVLQTGWGLNIAP